jgi:hypothetical protein
MVRDDKSDFPPCRQLFTSFNKKDEFIMRSARFFRLRSGIRRMKKDAAIYDRTRENIPKPLNKVLTVYTLA